MSIQSHHGVLCERGLAKVGITSNETVTQRVHLASRYCGSISKRNIPTHVCAATQFSCRQPAVRLKNGQSLAISLHRTQVRSAQQSEEADIPASQRNRDVPPRRHCRVTFAARDLRSPVAGYAQSTGTLFQVPALAGPRSLHTALLPTCSWNSRILSTMATLQAVPEEEPESQRSKCEATGSWVHSLLQSPLCVKQLL